MPASPHTRVHSATAPPTVPVILTACAVLFDMDGTIVDSSVPIRTCWGQWADRHGLDVREVLHVAHGRRSQDTIRHVLAHRGPDVARAETAWLDDCELREAHATRPLPGIRTLLDALPVGRWGIVTSAALEVCRRRLVAAGLPTPAVIVSGEDVTHGKPAPDGYQLGAARLGVAPADCLACEDTPTGIAAGRDAGMRIIGLVTTHAADVLGGCEVLRGDWLGVQVTTTPDAITLTFRT